MGKDFLKRKQIQALKVNQWLPEWNKIHWKPQQNRGEPRHWFYQFSMSAADLKKLSGVYARTTQRRRATDDLGTQRRHDPKRSTEIQQFVRYGYPWSDLSEIKRQSGRFDDLRQPGWLPTAIVVNILTKNDKRVGKKVSQADLITVTDHDDNSATIDLPISPASEDWEYESIPPIEIIDGQHRLWAFENFEFEGDFELPVVAYLGLEISWQAYLFYTINIKPKKINASLAYDLYPLLRTEEWLDKFEGHVIYRETRAQEIVDLLWSHPKSPWHKRINMLGEKGNKGLMVTQAAWVRSLLASFIKSWDGKGARIGGLFGTNVGRDETVLPWRKSQQAAFLICLGEDLQKKIKQCDAEWIKSLRKEKQPSLFQDNSEQPDLAFFGKNTLLNQDQGLRALLHVWNDMFFCNCDDLNLQQWCDMYDSSLDDHAAVNESLSSLYKKKSIIPFMAKLNAALAEYDWRASSAPDLSDEQKQQKAGFRGSSGYKELRISILKHLRRTEDEVLIETAAKIVNALGY